MKKATILLLVHALLLTPSVARAGYERTFASGSLIIPMDLAYQNHGILQAYGLLFQLLRQGVKVYWVIDADKSWHDEPCDEPGNECPWDCQEEGSGVKCPYPTASPDFFTSAEVVWDGEGELSPGDAIAMHGYRGGPFVIDSADRDAAQAIIDVWNDQSTWNANPWAQRSVFHVVTVHEATASFTGYVNKRMVAAPTIAVFADGKEEVATSYLRAAGIPQSNGNEFPDDKCDKIPCGAGTENPDMLTVPSVMGDMGTCDAPNNDHKNGALFTEEGVPAYCQIMSMHWDVKHRETVECNHGDCPDSPEQCAGEPITYHGHEVVAEVRKFLLYPVHFFAECQAVNAYENTVANPAWPWRDDQDRNGHYLTNTGEPPPPSCANDNDCQQTMDPGTEYVCAPNWCDYGTRDCCQSKEDKEKGAGFLIAGRPDCGGIKILHPEIAYNQMDGFFGTEGGSEPAYNLSKFLNTTYKNAMDITFITGPDGPGDHDVWMTGYLDGQCWVGCDPIGGEIGDCDPLVECTNGKVSYLGGHSYKTDVPIWVGENTCDKNNWHTQGTRLFLNALFEADCVTAAGQPDITLSLSGAATLHTQTLPVTATYTAGYANEAPGTAMEAVLTKVLAAGTSAADFQAGGNSTADGVEWQIGSIGGEPGQFNDPPSSSTRWTEVEFADVGVYELEVRLTYRVGMNTIHADPVVLTVEVVCDDLVDCTDDSSAGGACIFNPDDANCPDDGLYCNGPESCDSVSGCGHGGDPCPGTECNTCNEADDSCFDPEGTACDDGTFCNGIDTCDGAGVCVHAGDPCTGDTICSEESDTCEGCLADGDCDDGVECTNDSCVDGSCMNAPDDSLCPDDGLYCNGTESCSRGYGCVSTGNPCPGTVCNNVCNESDDNCQDPAGTPCDDGLFCNGVDTCNGAGNCVHSGDPCEAGLTCNEDDDTCEGCTPESDCGDGEDAGEEADVAELEPDMQPDTAQPDTFEPDTAEPDTLEPDTAEPDTAQHPDTGPLDSAVGEIGEDSAQFTETADGGASSGEGEGISESSGCGCRLGHRGTAWSPQGPWLLVLGLLVLGRLMRRRRRRRRSSRVWP